VPSEVCYPRPAGALTHTPPNSAPRPRCSCRPCVTTICILPAHPPGSPTCRCRGAGELADQDLPQHVRIVARRRSLDPVTRPFESLGTGRPPAANVPGRRLKTTFFLFFFFLFFFFFFIYNLFFFFFLGGCLEHAGGSPLRGQNNSWNASATALETRPASTRRCCPPSCVGDDVQKAAATGRFRGDHRHPARDRVAELHSLRRPASLSARSGRTAADRRPMQRYRTVSMIGSMEPVRRFGATAYPTISLSSSGQGLLGVLLAIAGRYGRDRPRRAHRRSSELSSRHIRPRPLRAPALCRPGRCNQQRRSPTCERRRPRVDRPVVVTVSALPVTHSPGRPDDH